MTTNTKASAESSSAAEEPPAKRQKLQAVDSDIDNNNNGNGNGVTNATNGFNAASDVDNASDLKSTS
eukprot:CAMPEP_0203719790 /NCGR_PEP_ID=MMETSP0092-20131115/3733_1 /ASSEMBLY_ACC=CAM_ASM_001090 /TAXON_ID=426623 /ORGANISM="Chaetoceros affinis, Strain CCMP159" /LENGTH=66 /DNA_ID=CAMNT_0050599281 /DNA_START=47 /DNA_END=244 /DNA_ORIENTATION=+